MAASLLSLLKSQPLPVLDSPAPASPLALSSLRGRFVEVSAYGSGICMSTAMQWVLDVQWEGEFAAWVQTRKTSFFPPDAAETGVDLAALPVICIDTPQAFARAAEQLLRSAAFSLLVLDMVGMADPQPLPMASQSRLLGLAQKHSAAIVCMSEKKLEAPSLGSLVSLRLHSHKRQTSGGRFCVEYTVVKDKRSGPGAHIERVFHGPAGVR